MTYSYAPILFFTALGFLFAVASVFVFALIGHRKWNRAKVEGFECGIQQTPQAGDRGRVPIKYFLVAMLFIVFDIESVFLYPFAVSFHQLGMFALVEMALFVVTVFAVYAYVWRRGGLDWD